MTGASTSGTDLPGRYVPGPYLVADAAVCGSRGVLAVVEAALAGGVRIIQLRSKAASARELYELTAAASRLTAGRATLLVNDQLDVALAARAAGLPVDGAHLGQDDVPAGPARAALGPTAVLGLTANTPAHLDAVAALPAGTVDYLGVGVIRPTDTKPDHPAPLGVAGFGRFAADAARLGLPCVAIGGITVNDTAALHAAGASGLAVVSAICAAPDPRLAAEAFTQAWAAAADGTPPGAGDPPEAGASGQGGAGRTGGVA
jgi:thiamine-phosphate diphosphorylase